MKKNRITFIFLFVLSIILLYNFGGFVSTLFFNTLLSVLLFSLLYTFYVYQRFKFVQTIDKKIIIKGEDVKLIVKLSNEDLLLYPFIYVSFFSSHSFFKQLSYSKCLTLNPYSKKEFVFDIECRYRGQYEIGISDIYIEDFLGLIRLKYKILQKKNIIVHPKIELLNNLNVFATNSSESHDFSQNFMEDVGNIRDLRDYYYGDNLRKIHWKLTARNNKLMIKNYQSMAAVNVNLILDLRKNIYSDEVNIVIEDKLIEAVVAILHYYLSKNIPVNYLYYNNKIEVFKAVNLIEFDTMYKTLSSIAFNQSVPLPDILKIHSESNNGSTNTILFTSILDIELYDEIYNAQLSNHSVCLIYVSPKTLVSENSAKSDIVDEILSTLPEIGVNAYTINPEDDLKVILGGLNNET